MTQPQHISEIYRKTVNLSFDSFIRDFHVAFGVSPMGMEKYQQVPMQHERHLNPTGRKNLMHRMVAFQRINLYPGPHLDNLNERVFARIEHTTRWRTIPKSCILSSTSEEMVVSLYQWCGEVIVDASTRAFFGDALVDTEPMVVRDFLEFEEYNWMILYQYPSFLAKKMSAPRERILQSFTRYVSLPPQRKQDTLGQAMDTEQIQAGIGIHDRAVVLQLIHFA